MNSTRATARFAGIVYLLFSLMAMFGYFYVPGRFVDAGNAAETARKITEGALLYRLGILASLLGHMLFLVLALALYQLFRDVDRVQARWLVALVCVGVAGELVNLGFRMAPLMLLSGADYLAPFSKSQLQTLALGFIKLGGSTSVILTMIWGLWLFPFGILTIKSGWFPKFLGYLLYASGVGYVITSVAEIAFPDGFRRISPFVTPLAVGELVMVLWLAIMGAKSAADRDPAGTRRRRDGLSASYPDQPDGTRRAVTPRMPGAPIRIAVTVLPETIGVSRTSRAHTMFQPTNPPPACPERLRGAPT